MVRSTSDLTEVRIGMPTVLACLATGFPIPSISWRKDGNEVNIYSDSSLNSRIDIIEFSPDNSDSDFESSGYMGSGSIENLLMMHTNFTVDQVQQLGELGVVSLLSFEDTVRRDTANYTCTATNSLPETTTLMDMSGNIPLVILGETNTEYTFFTPLLMITYSIQNVLIYLPMLILLKMELVGLLLDGHLDSMVTDQSQLSP